MTKSFAFPLLLICDKSFLSSALFQQSASLPAAEVERSRASNGNRENQTTQAGAGEEEGGGSSSSGPCVGALALLVDILLEPNSGQRDAKRAGELCEQLKTLDPIRERYWTWRAARAATAAPAPEAEADASAPMLGRMVEGNASLPPWWISAGVKPAGGEVDMGGWKAISFTEEQQEQFGIDSTGAVVDKAVHEAALAAVRAGALEVP